MSGVKNRNLVQALKYAKITAIVLALSSTGVLIQGSDWVYADTPADSEGGSENSSGSGGGNEAGASQESDASADANSDPNGDASATGTGSGEAGASGTSGGKTAEAEALYERGLVLSRHNLGEQHPDTLAIMSKQALFFRDEGRKPEALTLLEQVVHGFVNAPILQKGPVLESIACLVTLLHEQGRDEEAKLWQNKAREISESPD